MPRSAVPTRCARASRTLAAAACALALTLPVPGARAATLRLPALFSDHMVLQRGVPTPFHGLGSPGTLVTVRGDWGAASEARVRADGTWSAPLAPPATTGPHAITVEAADTTVRIADALAGEVWLCSGQSNMEMPLGGWAPDAPVAGSDSEIAAATDPALRLFTVTKRFSTTPVDGYDGVWVVCSPGAARDFSATGFFFGRALHGALGVPVGLVHASWGGTPVEAWMSRGALAAFPAYRDTLRWVAAGGDTLAARARWLRSHAAIAIDEAVPGKRWEDLSIGDEACAGPGLDDAGWRLIEVPGDWEDRGLGAFDGICWYRRSVPIPHAWIGRALTLRLGPVDDMDLTYVEGTLVGGLMGLDHWRTPRVYTVPASLVRRDTLVVAVRVVDFVGGGGLWGDGHPIDLFADSTGEHVALSGAWRLLPVAEFDPPTLYVLGSPPNDFAARPNLPIDLNARAATTLYNGMIAPLAPFALAGVAWYQGEDNVAHPESYARLFAAMIADWRATFGRAELPFAFVQIAPYEYGAGRHAELLREAQAEAAAGVPHAGMAVTIDLGDAGNIHPARKREVGERLAAWALASVYRRGRPAGGPAFRLLSCARGRATLSFAGAAGGLRLVPGTRGSGFQLAGGDGVFADADAVVRGGTVVLTSPRVAAPRAARYAFTNAPEATLFDGAGRPVAPFRTDAPVAGR